MTTIAGMLHEPPLVLLPSPATMSNSEENPITHRKGNKINVFPLVDAAAAALFQSFHDALTPPEEKHLSRHNRAST
jgi:hypothetical protein